MLPFDKLELLISLNFSFGGSGFVGRYVAQRMAKQGWRVRVAVRRPNEALFVRQYGAVGQVEPVLCNIRDDASVIKVIIGANAVVTKDVPEKSIMAGNPAKKIGDATRGFKPYAVTDNKED